MRLRDKQVQKSGRHEPTVRIGSDWPLMAIKALAENEGSTKDGYDWALGSKRAHHTTGYFDCALRVLVAKQEFRFGEGTEFPRSLSGVQLTHQAGKIELRSVLDKLSIANPVELDAVELHRLSCCGNSLELALMRASQAPPRDHGMALGDAILDLNDRIGEGCDEALEETRPCFIVQRRRRTRKYGAEIIASDGALGLPVAIIECRNPAAI